MPASSSSSPPRGAAAPTARSELRARHRDRDVARCLERRALLLVAARAYRRWAQRTAATSREDIAVQRIDVTAPPPYAVDCVGCQDAHETMRRLKAAVLRLHQRLGARDRLVAYYSNQRDSATRLADRLNAAANAVNASWASPGAPGLLPPPRAAATNSSDADGGVASPVSAASCASPAGGLACGMTSETRKAAKERLRPPPMPVTFADPAQPSEFTTADGPGLPPSDWLLGRHLQPPAPHITETEFRLRLDAYERRLRQLGDEPAALVWPRAPVEPREPKPAKEQAPRSVAAASTNTTTKITSPRGGGAKRRAEAAAAAAGGKGDGHAHKAAASTPPSVTLSGQDPEASAANNAASRRRSAGPRSRSGSLYDSNLVITPASLTGVPAAGDSTSMNPLDASAASTPPIVTVATAVVSDDGGSPQQQAQQHPPRPLSSCDSIVDEAGDPGSPLEVDVTAQKQRQSTSGGGRAPQAPASRGTRSAGGSGGKPLVGSRRPEVAPATLLTLDEGGGGGAASGSASGTNSGNSTSHGNANGGGGGANTGSGSTQRDQQHTASMAASASGGRPLRLQRPPVEALQMAQSLHSRAFAPSQPLRNAGPKNRAAASSAPNGFGASAYGANGATGGSGATGATGAYRVQPQRQPAMGVQNTRSRSRR